MYVLTVNNPPIDLQDKMIPSLRKKLHNYLPRTPDITFVIAAALVQAEKDLIDRDDVIDTTVVRVEKAYPAYFGGYDNFNTIRKYTDSIENLFLIGRNGMHRYNNMDHSMLTAMAAVENIITGKKTKDNIWNID